MRSQEGMTTTEDTPEEEWALEAAAGRGDMMVVEV
jgi:hypothetical protein